MDLADASARARIADAEELITADELQLAARNHGLPLEALRYDVTPPGLHYTLTHYDIPAIEPGDWRLTISGAVHRRSEFSLDDLMSMPSRTVRVTLECAGNGRARLLPRPISQPWLVEAVGTADWTGVPLAHLLDDGALTGEAREIVFTGADHGVERGIEQDYQRSLTVAEACGADVLLAYAMNGQPLPPQHGYPLRLIVPGWYGMAHVKWLRSIEAVSEPFTGFQNDVAYRLRRESGEHGSAITRMEPRALMIPPGYPDFMSRTRFLRPGQVSLTGRAWSGWSGVDRVMLSTDDGESWREAKVEPADSPWAWRSFSLTWDAIPGDYVLMARAYDSTGHEQPLAAAWNRGGFANNSVQRTKVLVINHSP
jgi:DMSO/TMAO reductase YedYZ molybdopterin-dependent catalytic subunit